MNPVRALLVSLSPFPRTRFLSQDLSDSRDESSASFTMRDLSLAYALAFQRIPVHTADSRTGVLSTTPFASPPAGLTPSSTATFLTKKSSNNDVNEDLVEEPRNNDQEIDFLRDELDHIQSLEEIVDELEEFAFDDFEDNEDDEMVWSEEALKEIFGEISDNEDGDDDDDDDVIDDDDDDDDGDSEVLDDFDDEFDDNFGDDDEFDDGYMEVRTANDFQRMEERIRLSAAADLERALLQGVVPVSAGVGNEVLPGDYGFDPFHLSDKDYFRQAQGFLINLLPSRDDITDDEHDDDIVPVSITKNQTSSKPPRPKALILRDLREAETRHGRLAMLAAVFWPLQEMLDRLLLDPEQCGPILYGPITLPYFPLLMTGIMLLLGYLDIYAQEVKQQESIGEAFLPGDCFWDPLRILQGAPDSMKRNMQERELFNGRVAMLAFLAFVWEEGIAHLPLIEIGENDLLLEPAYEIPFIQQWLDSQFSVTDTDIW